MLTIDIADRLRRAHTDDGRKWKDLPSEEKVGWIHCAELVEGWVRDAMDHSKEYDGEFDYDYHGYILLSKSSH